MEIEAGSGKQGLKTVVAALHDPAAPVPGSDCGEQLPLLPLEGAGVGAPPDAAPRGKGRPPGSVNKNTEEWRKYLLSQYRSPLDALAQTFNLPIETLAKHLGLISKPTFDQALELLKLQITAAKELAPYVHQKMPIALDAGSGGLIQLVINQQAAVASAGADAIPQAFAVLNSDHEENQMVTASDFTESNNSHSNEKV